MNTESSSTSSEEEEEGCESCRFFVPYVTVRDGETVFLYGECHRFPPQTQKVPCQAYPTLYPNVFDWTTFRPRVEPTTWCGEYTSKDEHQP